MARKKKVESQEPIVVEQVVEVVEQVVEVVAPVAKKCKCIECGTVNESRPCKRCGGHICRDI